MAPPAFAQAPEAVANVVAFHRSGQTFITWTERSAVRGETYHVYRHTEPITAANLAQARLLYEVPEGSGRFYADRYRAGDSWKPRYLERYVIEDGGDPIAEGTGLLVWTLAPEDFGGADAGDGYYAVTLVDTAGAEAVSVVPESGVGPVAEQVADPAPVEIFRSADAVGHVYIQYMDLRRWNPTFHAPRPGNGYYGLDAGDPAVAGALQYAYTYAVGEPDPAMCGGRVPDQVPVLLVLHSWQDGAYGPDAGPTRSYCAFEVRPVDVGDTWYLGFAVNHDYRGPDPMGPGDAIANYTEERILRMLYDLLRDPALGPRVDPNRVYVYGHSMGGGGALALALRYPGVFAAAYASQPMTDFRAAGGWLGGIAASWGSPELNLPVRIAGPGDWADHLKQYNGTGVYDWQDHRAALSRGDETAPLALAAGLRDTTVPWTTQGAPAFAALDADGHVWAGAVTDTGHTWQGFRGLPPTLALTTAGPFAGLRAVLSESVPGLANASGNPALPPEGVGGYNQTLAWSASWEAWDGPPVDTAEAWRISLRTTDGSEQTVDVTPRRLQQFVVAPWAAYSWENRLVTDDAVIASGTVTSDGRGLLTVPAFAVLPQGNRLLLWPAGASAPEGLPVVAPTATPEPAVATATPLPSPTPTDPPPTATPTATAVPTPRPTLTSADIPSADRPSDALLRGLLPAAAIVALAVGGAILGGRGR